MIAGAKVRDPARAAAERELIAEYGQLKSVDPAAARLVFKIVRLLATGPNRRTPK